MGYSEKLFSRSWQGGPNPLFYDGRGTLVTSPFSKFCPPPSTHLFFDLLNLETQNHKCLALWFKHWSGTWFKHWRFRTDEIIFASTLIWYHTHTDTFAHRQDTKGPIEWHTDGYILIPPVICSQQISVLHWMNNSLKAKFTLQSCSKVSLFVKKY